jgi:hypothetical protein
MAAGADKVTRTRKVQSTMNIELDDTERADLIECFG